MPVVTLAVLGDEESGWRPGPYEWGKWGCRVRFDYLTCKLLDLRAAPALATPGMNPAAIVVAAHLEAQATARDGGGRFRGHTEFRGQGGWRRWATAEAGPGGGPQAGEPQGRHRGQQQQPGQPVGTLERRATWRLEIRDLAGDVARRE